jgi:predicted HNH restriction endonuclease
LQKRNTNLRKQAIAVYGEGCRACGFNFGDFYGELGAGYIEVHHLKPLSRRKAERKTTIEDVDVVCANRHRVLHRNGRKPLSLDELRKSIRRRK